MEFDSLLHDFRNDVEELNYFGASTVSRRQGKRYKDRRNPLQDLSDDDFRLRYRFSKANMCRIIEILRSDLQVDSRGGSISVELQVMAVIRYWGRHEVRLPTLLTYLFHSVNILLVNSVHA